MNLSCSDSRRALAKGNTVQAKVEVTFVILNFLVGMLFKGKTKQVLLHATITNLVNCCLLLVPRLAQV